jgi:quinoprotein glucose dehydrogenase
METARHLARVGRVLPLAIVLVWTIPVTGQQGAKDGTGKIVEWRYYHGDQKATRYSPLDQINKDNVADLELAWRFPMDSFGPRPEYKNETTPIMVKGVLYFTAGFSRNVVAANAATGEMLWMWRMDEGVRGEKAPRGNSGRGVAYWTDGRGDERIYTVTPGYHLVALNAKTGLPVPGFGRNGVVDLMQGVRGKADPVGAIGNSSPPLIAKDVLVVPPALESGFRPRSKTNIPADIRGFDVRTGRTVWTFKTIPSKGESGF